MRSWPADELLPRLEVEPVDEHEFASVLEGFEGRSFGGEILSKAAMAAMLTASGRALHSLHAYFLRAAPPEEPLRFTVHALRNGRRLSSRRVTIRHAGRIVAEVAVSLAAEFEGAGFEDQPHALGLPAPHLLPGLEELAASEGMPPPPEHPLEWRHVDDPWRTVAPGERAQMRAWVRLRRSLPDDPRFHVAALAYLSDFRLLAMVGTRLGAAFDWNTSASLDHALWLHRPFRWNDWILMESHTDIAYGGRALLERRFYAADGARIASIVQEGLFGTKVA